MQELNPSRIQPNHSFSETSEKSKASPANLEKKAAQVDSLTKESGITPSNGSQSVIKGALEANIGAPSSPYAAEECFQVSEQMLQNVIENKNKFSTSSELYTSQKNNILSLKNIVKIKNEIAITIVSAKKLSASALCKTASFSLKFFAKLTFVDENARKNFKIISIKYQVKAEHHLWKISDVYNKFLFGEKLLTTSRNIGKKIDFQKEQMKLALEEINKFYKIKNINETVNEFPIILDGVCFGTSIDFIARYYTNKDVRSVAEVNEKGSPLRAVVNQAIYDRSANKNRAEKELADFNGIVQGKLYCINISNRSTADQLRDADATIPYGAYELGFRTGSGWHSIVLIKEEGKNYIFDPNYGLIDIGDNLSQGILNFLNLYDPPDQKVPIPNKVNVNYDLKIIGYTLR